jgi:Tfp pilus assembly protein PilF
MTALWRRRAAATVALAAIAFLTLGAAVSGWYAFAEYHYRRGLEALQRRDFAGARAHLEKALEVWPGSAEVHLLAAQAARRAGAYAPAEKHLDEARRRGGVLEAVDLERALLRVQRGDLAQLEGTLLEFVRRGHPDTDLILEALARGYLKTYRLRDAEHCLDQWLERRPDDVQALLWRADARERRLGLEEALADYGRAVELDPERADARLHLAELLVRVNQPARAVAHFEWLREREPRKNKTALLGLARCRRLLGQPEGARELLDRLLNASPGDPGALLERAKLALEAGQRDPAERCLRTAFSVAPNDREVVYTLYLCLQQGGKTGEAREYQARLQTIDAQLDRLADLSAAIGRAPHDPAPRCAMGLIFLSTGQATEGLRWLQSALDEDPHYAPAHRALAEYFDRTGDPGQAAQHRQLARRQSDAAETGDVR